MGDFKVGQLAKELVVGRLRDLPNPCMVAAEVVKRTLLVALKDGGAPDWKVIEDACQGGMTGLLLTEQDLAKGAVLILTSVADIATDLHLDPSEAMHAALRGLADIRRFAGSEKLLQIRDAIEARYMGVGEAFATILKSAPVEGTERVKP